MTEKQATDKLFTDWGKMLTGLWNPSLNNLGNIFQKNGENTTEGLKGRMGESLQASAKMWQSMMGAMSEPEALETFQKATKLTPDIALGFAQSSMNGFTKCQDQMVEWIQKRAQAEDSVDVQAMDKEFIRKWKDAYENEFSQYLKVPQIGIGRLYQERAMNATDKLNVFQSVLSEFLHTLYLPMEKAFKSLQEKMAEMTEDDGPLDEKSKTYYNLWIKILEGHYMELFKQPEFIENLTNTLSALEEYSSARQEVVNDLLKMYAIPTNNELDDLYKEIYLLKKRMRKYEKIMGHDPRQSA